MEQQFVLGHKHYLKVTFFLKILIILKTLVKNKTSKNECSFKTKHSKWHFGQVEQGAKRPKRKKKLLIFFIKKS
jgi:hypothetical protein